MKFRAILPMFFVVWQALPVLAQEPPGVLPEAEGPADISEQRQRSSLGPEVEESMQLLINAFGSADADQQAMADRALRHLRQQNDGRALEELDELWQSDLTAVQQSLFQNTMAYVDALVLERNFDRLPQAEQRLDEAVDAVLESDYRAVVGHLRFLTEESLATTEQQDLVATMHERYMAWNEPGSQRFGTQSEGRPARGRAQAEQEEGTEVSPHVEQPGLGGG